MDVRWVSLCAWAVRRSEIGRVCQSQLGAAGPKLCAKGEILWSLQSILVIQHG